MERLDKRDFSGDRDEVFSRAVRAGKRTYFFDVKTTRNNDYYLTITESKKKYEDNGASNFEKHKIFLYKEDFEKFAVGLEEVVNYIKDTMGDNFTTEHRAKEKELDISFEEFL